MPLDLDSAQVRRFAGPALRAFGQLAERWGLTEAQQAILLGNPAERDLAGWRHGDYAGVNSDVLERVSFLLGIHKALAALLSTPAAQRRWIAGPNTAPTFAGRSPLDLMLEGSVGDLATVRAYLDAQFEWG